MSRPPQAGPSTNAPAIHRTGRSTADNQVVPVEIFYHICENLPQDSLATVARTNTSLAQVSERYIYRQLHLSTIPQALQCFQTLMAKASAAQSVREFIIMIKYVLKNDLPAAWFQFLRPFSMSVVVQADAHPSLGHGLPLPYFPSRNLPRCTSRSKDLTLQRYTGATFRILSLSLL